MAKRWTQEEEDFLKNNYKTMSYQEIGLILGKKITQVKSKREKLGLCSQRQIFLKEEIDFVTNNYPNFSRKTIAEKLNITISRVQAIIVKLKINARKTFFKHDYLSIPSIQKILNIPVTFLESLVKCKFIRISLFKTEIRNGFRLVHIDEFEKIKDFLNNYITVEALTKEIFLSANAISYRIKTKKLKNFVKVGVKYFIHKSEIEIQRAL